MPHSFPRPDWVSDRLVDERGEHAGFQMYTREGNNAVAEMVIAVIARAEQTRARRDEIRDLLREGVAEVAKVHPEVHDTEPEWAIVDAINLWLDGAGFVRIDRDDLF
jgi:hypothetical protein